jgi:hypothetical protein
MLLFRGTFICGPSERTAVGESFWHACQQLQLPAQANHEHRIGQSSDSMARSDDYSAGTSTNTDEIASQMLGLAFSRALAPSCTRERHQVSTSLVVVNDAAQMLWVYALRVWRSSTAMLPEEFHTAIKRLIAQGDASVWLAGVALILYRGIESDAMLFSQAAVSNGLSICSWRKLAALAEVSKILYLTLAFTPSFLGVYRHALLLWPKLFPT